MKKKKYKELKKRVDELEDLVFRLDNMSSAATYSHGTMTFPSLCANLEKIIRDVIAEELITVNQICQNQKKR